MTPSNLRPSQVEVLKAVHELASGYDSEGAQAARVDAVALKLDRSEHSTELSLIRLVELGYLSRNWFGPPLAFSTYRLSPAGKAVVGEET